MHSIPSLARFPTRARAARRTRGARAMPVTGRWLAVASVALAALAWAAPAGAVELNSATVAQLQSVRGIGPKTARTIVDERTRAGRFRSFSDLSDRVRGIGPRRAEALQAAGLRIEPAGPAAAAGAGGKPAPTKTPPAAQRPAR